MGIYQILGRLFSRSPPQEETRPDFYDRHQFCRTVTGKDFDDLLSECLDRIPDQDIEGTIIQHLSSPKKVELLPIPEDDLYDHFRRFAYFRMDDPYFASVLKTTDLAYKVGNNDLFKKGILDTIDLLLND